MADQPVAGDPAGREDEDPFDVVFHTFPQDGGGVVAGAEPLPNDATHVDEAPDEPVGERTQESLRDKVHPVLRRWLAIAPRTLLAQLVVVFAEQRRIPRFPEFAVDEPRESDRNQRLQERADELVRSIEEERAPQYGRLIGELTAQHPEIEVLERFWLTTSVLVAAPLGAVERLALAPYVLSIEPRWPEEEPPSGEIIDGRARIRSDPLFAARLADTWIALLDTGVRATHVLLTGPSHLGLLRDCVAGGPDCNTGGPLETGDAANHGTASAAILTANIRKTDLFRGVTQAPVDSFKVYLGNALDVVAAKRGFQMAVQSGDRVVVVEIQDDHDELSALALDADAAFMGGAVVVAANGNSPPGGPAVKAPANAHCVIGVGAFSVLTKVQYPGQCDGPTKDGRIKPDVQGPTDTESASNANDVLTRTHSGTSGATPYIGGAAALVRSWIRHHSGSIDPGQVYALLVLFGTKPAPFTTRAGGGPLRLDLGGYTWWGKLAVNDHSTTDVPIVVGAGAAEVHAAVWWPEVPGEPDPHNHITLTLRDAAGAARCVSDVPLSVFGRCSVNGTIGAGTWRVSVSGVDVPHGPQTVYWAARAR